MIGRPEPFQTLPANTNLTQTSKKPKVVREKKTTQQDQNGQTFETPEKKKRGRPRNFLVTKEPSPPHYSGESAPNTDLDYPSNDFSETIDEQTGEVCTSTTFIHSQLRGAFKMETVCEKGVKEEGDTKPDGNSEKYRKYRLKQKAKMNNLQESLDGAIGDIERLKEREKKLLYALLFAHKKLSVKENEIMALKSEAEHLRTVLDAERGTQQMLQQILYSLNQVKEQTSNQPITNVSFGVTSTGSSSTIIRTTSGQRLDLPRPPTYLKGDQKIGFEMPTSSLPDFQSFLEYYDKFTTGEDQVLDGYLQDIPRTRTGKGLSSLGGKSNPFGQDDSQSDGQDSNSRKVQRSMNSFDQLVNAAVIDDSLKTPSSTVNPTSSSSNKRPAEQTPERDTKKPGYFAEIFRNSPSPLEKR